MCNNYSLVIEQSTLNLSLEYGKQWSAENNPTNDLRQSLYIWRHMTMPRGKKEKKQETRKINRR